MGGRLRDGRAVVPDVAGEPAESRLRTRPARGTTKRKHELSKMRRGHRAATGQSGLGSVGPAHIGGTERGHEPRPAEGDSEAEERQQMRKWVGKTPSPKPQLWYTKGEALKAGAIRPVKVRFPFCWGWCDLYDGIKLTDGRTCPTHSAMLVVNGVASDVVGMRDMQAVTWPEDLASAWRASFEQEL